MDKGYAINKINDQIITDATKVKKADILTTTLKNGSIISEVIEVCENGK
jgi:exonuclease VII large subunit